MSDLQCPATLVVVAPADATVDRVQRAAAADVAAVYAGPADRAPGELLAEALGVRLFDEPSLAGEDPCDALRSVADLHRGETVVVVSGTAYQALGDAGGVEPVVARIDADGLVVSSP